MMHFCVKLLLGSNASSKYGGKAASPPESLGTINFARILFLFVAIRFRVRCLKGRTGEICNAACRGGCIIRGLTGFAKRRAKMQTRWNCCICLDIITTYSVCTYRCAAGRHVLIRFDVLLRRIHVHCCRPDPLPSTAHTATQLAAAIILVANDDDVTGTVY